MADRPVSCRHCGVRIHYDPAARGPAGGWRSPDGLTCTHHAGHTPTHPPASHYTKPRPGY